MPLAKPASITDARIKLLIWGEPGSGKSRASLTAPSPIVADLEGSTALYSDEFDFFLAQPDSRDKRTTSHAGLINVLTDEIAAGEYPDRETLIIDPISDYLDDLEARLATQFEKAYLKNVTTIADLNAVQKTKWYAFRRDEIRKRLDKIKALPINVILVGRSRLLWSTLADGSLKPTGQAIDAVPILESLMDVVLEMRKSSSGRFEGNISKSRLGSKIGSVTFVDMNDLFEQLKQGSRVDDTITKEEQGMVVEALGGDMELLKMLEQRMGRKLAEVRSRSFGKVITQAERLLIEQAADITRENGWNLGEVEKLPAAAQQKNNPLPAPEEANVANATVASNVQQDITSNQSGREKKNTTGEAKSKTLEAQPQQTKGSRITDEQLALLYNMIGDIVNVDEIIDIAKTEFKVKDLEELPASAFEQVKSLIEQVGLPF